ncbi:PREDICTED: fasciclin-2 isoform X3 [Polistes canadensis]|uniref:fasciclin-2 isoform X3 n=1 Tax=Polistes canadensis TaxID=91411 RepID=UPI00071901C6|nr:PREDICTED: fasciclin-2 isoform X3 [Polistes canadensis]
MAVDGHPAAIYFIALFYLTFAGNANATSLEILPSGETQTKPIGSSIILTCKPNVDNLGLVSDMQWLDPQNRVIESLKLVVLPIESTSPLVHGHSKPAMYTELHQDNSLSLFFYSLQEEQAGKYTCKGTYANSVPLNKSVTIDTIVAITFDNAPENQYPVLGKDFAILCKVRARPSPSVDWLYNGELVKTNDRYIIDTHALKIKNVQESDDGIYTCRASVLTTGELKERPIRVEVHIRPTIEERSTPVDIIEGENQKIECKAKGKPPPRFSWIQSLTKQNLSSTDRFTVNPDTGDLTITNVNREDAGEYECTATNAADSATTNIVVNVIVKPKIMEFPNITVIQGKEVDVKCKAFGRPPPKVTLRKHTAEKAYVLGAQVDDDRIVLINKPDEVTGETVGILNIRDVFRSNDGLYECVAENAGGKAYKNGHVTVEFPPTFAYMENNTTWSWDSRPVNLTCIAESIPNATITWTMGADRKIEDVPEIKQLGNGPISTLMIIPLDGRYYTTYKCIAANSHGTRVHKIELKQATKPGELTQVKVAEKTATTIKFDFVLPYAHRDLPIKSVIVQYKEETQTWADARNRTWSINSIYVLEGLKPQTPYDFRFAAINKVGQGNWGGFYRETTPVRTVPTAPKIITNKLEPNGYDVSTFSNQYELFWTVPVDNGEPIEKYIVKYCQVKRVTGEWQTEEDTCKTLDIKGAGRTKCWIPDIHSDTFYVVEVRAQNIIGLSKPGVAKFKTSRGPDTKVVHHHGPLISSAAIIGIVIAVLFIIIVIIDVICCCAHKTGIIYYVCERSRRKPVDEEDSKLGRDEKEPLKEEKKITPIIDSGLRRETSVTFDGKRSVSKTGFVGKDSAV